MKHHYLLYTITDLAVCSNLKKAYEILMGLSVGYERSYMQVSRDVRYTGFYLQLMKDNSGAFILKVENNRLKKRLSIGGKIL